MHFDGLCDCSNGHFIFEAVTEDSYQVLDRSILYLKWKFRIDVKGGGRSSLNVNLTSLVLISFFLRSTTLLSCTSLILTLTNRFSDGPLSQQLVHHWYWLFAITVKEIFLLPGRMLTVNLLLAYLLSRKTGLIMLMKKKEETNFRNIYCTDN